MSERTSARVAKIAGRILAADYVRLDIWPTRKSHGQWIDPDDVRALAASALTQAPDRKPKRAPKRRARRK